MNQPIIDDVFQVYERLETKHATKVTEENIVHLARLFEGEIHFTEGRPVLKIKRDGRLERHFTPGDWIDNQGRDALGMSAWKPQGTYSEVDRTPNA